MDARVDSVAIRTTTETTYSFVFIDSKRSQAHCYTIRAGIFFSVYLTQTKRQHFNTKYYSKKRKFQFAKQSSALPTTTI